MNELEAKQLAAWGKFHKQIPNKPSPYLSFVAVHNWMWLDINQATGKFALGYAHGNVYLSTKWIDASKEELVRLIDEMELSIAAVLNHKPNTSTA